MSVPEERILVRKDPITDDNPDLWPTFGLRKIKVISQETGEFVSLLSAHKENPVTVTGQLDEPQEEDRKLVRIPDYRDKTIEIKDVKTYAFAEYEDGTYGFWAAGKAGWFEFETTARSYRQIHKQMIEATSILYFLADRLRKKKHVPIQSAKELDTYVRQCCLDYLAQSKDGARFTDIEDVREAFHEHREFLITSMLEGQESLDWNGTPMLNYFKQKFPDEVERMNFKPQPSTSKQSAPQIPKSTSKEEVRKRKSTSPPAVEPTTKKRRGRQPKPMETQPPPSKAAATRQKDAADASEEELHDSSATTRKRKSMLRPPGSKSAKKTRKTPGRKPKHLQDAESDESSDEAKASMPPSITTIKTGDELDIITNPHHRPASPNTSPKPPDSEPTYLPRKYLEIRLVEYPIPSMKPQGPGDLWTCEVEGCRRRVHEGSTEEGKARIRAHMEGHVGPQGIEARDKIDLALDESRPYLPVNNLVRRLQAWAPEPGKEPAPDSIQRKFSAPIRNRY